MTDVARSLECGRPMAALATAFESGGKPPHSKDGNPGRNTRIVIGTILRTISLQWDYKPLSASTKRLGLREKCMGQRFRRSLSRLKSTTCRGGSVKGFVFCSNLLGVRH